MKSHNLFEWLKSVIFQQHAFYSTAPKNRERMQNIRLDCKTLFPSASQGEAA